MKIAFVTAGLSRHAGGLFDSMVGAGQALANRPGIEVTALGFLDEAFAEDQSKWGKVSVQAFPIKGPRSFAYTPDMTEALLQGGFDIVHTHGLWVYASVAVKEWHRQTRKPYLISPHGMLDPWALKNSGWKKRLAAILYERDHLRSAACFQALCEAEASSIEKYGLSQPIAVIPNGVDLPPDEPSPSSVETSRQKTLLYLGRLHPKKNLSPLIQAWNQLRPSDWVLKIAGWSQGGYENELQSLIAEFGLNESVQLIGPQFGSSRISCYQNCDAFILPSLSEGLPMTVLEAWSYAKPVLMTAACNLPEGFATGAALQIGSSADSMENELRQFFQLTDDKRTAIGNKGRLLVTEKFHWPQVAVQLESLYHWLLAQGPKPPSIRA